ncbi:MAG: CYTH and CHAD domain-containing protein [Alphaproteobacteria bacterium]|nr:CYTH and CHAD domain-containing protein [Alphaproteobacteria bacterium]
MTEIELKLAVAPEDFAKAKNALLAMAEGRQGSSSSLNSTYYDTSGLALRDQDLTLRVRKTGQRFIQTVKAQNSGGNNLTRGEWEDSIAGELPDLAAPASSRRLPRTLGSDELRPLFTTEVRRVVVMLEPRPSTVIEAALDEGEIRTSEGEAAEPISELELELKSGDPAVLFDVALRLLEVAPLRLEMRSKSERGYRLVEGADAAPSVVHAKPTTLESDMTVEAMLQSVGRQCMAQLLRNEPAALAGAADGIHQMRVAVRRLRSALSAVQPMLPAEHYRWATGELKHLAGSLGAARNWDVFATSLLQPINEAAIGQDIERLASAADQRRRAAHAAAKQAILEPRYTISVLKLWRWIEARGWRDQPVSEESALLLAPVGAIAPDLIARRHRQVKARSKQFETLAPEQRHKLRIALKKLRYTIEFLASLFDDDAVAAFLKQLKPLQDDLGHTNDVRVARDLLAELREANADAALDRAGGIVLGWHDRGLADNEPRIRKHVRQLRRAKPFW